MKPEDYHFIVQYSAGDCTEAIKAELATWQSDNKIQRLWDHDPSLWTNNDEDKWMGWLDVAVSEEKEIPRIDKLGKELKASGITDIVLLGMGGSSLCPAMIAETFGHIDGFPHLHILDSTDPLQIQHLHARLDLGKTFFIVSSKSGSTLEPNIFKEYFYAELQAVLNKTDVGERFCVITDPDTSLEKLAQMSQFKAIFHGIPSIGGRYSALSNFGMVPSGLMGVDIRKFLSHAQAMHQACSPATPIEENPGVVLGVVLGVCALHKKDKITLVASPGIRALGAWLEQLIAESTGKKGKGLIPIDQEPLGDTHVYGSDRVFVYIRLNHAPDSKQDQAIDAIEQAGFVVVRLHLHDKMHLGAELFRWEIATDVAGSIIGIDPFNQPDVEGSKVLTLQFAAEYEKSGKLVQPEPFYQEQGISLYTDAPNYKALEANLQGEKSLANFIRAHLKRIQKNDYVDLSAFIEMSEAHTSLLQESRTLIRDATQAATCLGFGPRFLHSTGQDYKGGPNTGVFFQITANYKQDIQVPGHRYTFGLVITAQAQADFAVLGQRGRRILRIHLGHDVENGLKLLRDVIHEVFVE